MSSRPVSYVGKQSCREVRTCADSVDVIVIVPRGSTYVCM